MALAFIFGINQDIIQGNNNQHNKFFYEDLINVTLKSGQGIKKSKKHYLILQMVVSNAKNCFIFIAYYYFHHIVDANNI